MVCRIASSGACKMIAKGSEKMTSIAVMKTVITENSLLIPHTIFPAFSVFFAPLSAQLKPCPHRFPVTMVVTATINWLSVVTADILAVEPNCPTTMRSIAPYKACKNNDSIKGIAKRIITGKIFSCKKSLPNIIFLTAYYVTHNTS